MTLGRLAFHLLTIFSFGANAVAPIQSRTDSQLVARSAQRATDASGDATFAQDPDDALGAVMRREALGKGLMPAALEQRDSSTVSDEALASDDESKPHSHRHGGHVPQKPADSIGQVLSRELLKIPEGQKPVYAAAFLMVFGASGFLFYALLSAKFGRDERQIFIRRKLMNMNSPPGGPEVGGKGFSKGLKGSITEQVDVISPKGLGKGKGKGKPVGKGSWKGASSKGSPTQSEPAMQPMSLGAMALALGRRSKGPGSVSSIASSQTSGLSASISNALVARSSASTWTSPEERVHSLESTVPERHKAVKSAVSDLLAMLRSVEKIQRAWRRWKANQKLPLDGQCITFLCDVLEGENMPNVNRFGGCDPFIECRIVKADPSHVVRGDLDTPPLLSAQTDVRRNDMTPRWGQRLTLSDLAYQKGLFVQLALWDYNLSRSQPIGHVAMPITRALTTHGMRRPPRTVEVSPLPGAEIAGLQAKVSIQCSFRETFKYRLVIASGSGLTQVAPNSNAVPLTRLASSFSLPNEADMAGTIHSYVEARIMSEDPRKASCLPCANNSTRCLWTGRTDAQGGDGEPVWDQELEFNLDDSAETMWLQLLLWDANTPSSSAPIGHAVMEMTKANVGRQRDELVDHALRLQELVERLDTIAPNSTLAIRVGRELAMA